MMQFCAWMIQPERVLRRGQVVAQHQIKLIIGSAATGDRSDGIVRNTVSFRKDHRGFIGV